MNITCPHCNQKIELIVKKPISNGALWDKICELWKWNPVTKAEKTRLGKIVKDLQLKQAEPGEIQGRISAMKAEWGRGACTPEAIVKHWDMFKPAPEPKKYVPEIVSDRELAAEEDIKNFKNEFKQLIRDI